MVKPITYQVAYLWTCPDCDTTWQLRRRPRTGQDLVCVALSEQRMVETREWAGPAFRGCAAVHASAGRRGGIAPNVSV